MNDPCITIEVEIDEHLNSDADVKARNNKKVVVEAESSASARGLRQRWLQRLERLREARCAGGGVWAACDACGKFRLLPQLHEPLQLPARWHCGLHPDARYSRCEVPEQELSVAAEEALVHAQFAPGSVVWARLPGYPAWPALVDDDPDVEQYYWLDGFSDIPTHYSVVFFDSPGRSAERAWIPAARLRAFSAADTRGGGGGGGPGRRFAARLRAARGAAGAALALPVPERLMRCGVLARCARSINPPRA